MYATLDDWGKGGVSKTCMLLYKEKNKRHFYNFSTIQYNKQ